MTLDEAIKAEIEYEKEFACADFERYKVEILGADWETVMDELPDDEFRYGMERCIEIIDKHIAKDIVEQCEDCISRESAKAAIREKFKDLPIRCEINEVLNGIQSVQPARPKGKWRFAGDGVVECNKCETAYSYDLFPRNFCPNCGADMKGD